MKSAASSKIDPLTLSGEIHLRKDSASAKALKAGTAERRIKLRINHPFPTKACGTDAAGQTFEVDCMLDNISSSGLYLRLPRQLNSGAELSLVIKFLNGQGTGASALLLGQVLRDELQPDGNHGLALAIKEHHFL